LSVATGAIRRLASVHLRAWGGCLALISRGVPRRLLDRTSVMSAGVYGPELSHVASVAGGSHVHVHSCADAADVCLFARLLFGLSHSLTLHGLLPDYRPNQRERWRHGSFSSVTTQRLRQEVQHALIGALPE
jgi:colanic acid/amylovoran biosynthesis glycosyltransferase